MTVTDTNPDGAIPDVPEIETPPAKPEGKVLNIPESAMGHLKAAERKAGAEKARLEAAAEAGFTSFEEMMAAAKEAAATRAAAKAEADKAAAAKAAAEKAEADAAAEKAAADKKKSPDTTELNRARLDAKLAKERDDALARAKKAEADAETARNEARAASARADFRVRVTRLAIEAGAHDADDIVPLVEAQVAALKPDEVGTFDAKAAVKALQTTKEHLFKPATVPAGGSRVRSAPPTPAPTPGGRPKSAFDMTPEELSAATNRYYRP